jgi:tyrosine-protein kinase Etk/Wzc
MNRDQARPMRYGGGWAAPPGSHRESRGDGPRPAPTVAERGHPSEGCPPSASSSTSLARYLDILSRRKLLAILVFSAAIALTLLVTARTKPLYEAGATLMVESDNNRSILGDSKAGALFGFNSPHIANHVELLRSRGLAQRVVARLPDSILAQLQSYRPYPSYPAPDAAQLLQALVSARPLRETDIVQLRITAPSAVLATTLANLYADAYQDYNLDLSRTDVSAIRRFIEGQLALIGMRLDSAEESLERFKRRNRMINLDAETKALIDQQSDLATLHQQTLTQTQGDAAQLDHVRGLIEREAQGATAKLEDISSPLVANLKATLDQLEVEHANLLIRMGTPLGGMSPYSARMQNLSKQIADTRERLVRESGNLVSGQAFIDPVGRLKDLYQTALTLETGLAASRTRAGVLEQALAENDARLTRLPRTERVLARLTREVETDRRVYSLLSEHYEEARIQEVGRIPSVRIVDAAQGARKTRPNVPSNLMLGFVLALLLASASAFAVDYLDTSVHTPQELERHGFSVLASIPLLGGNELNRRAAGHAGRSPRRGEITAHLITHANPESSGAEAFRMLRTSISFAGIDRPIRTIVVASACPGEGKSTVAVNLATVLAQAGRKTLLVDADLRRPVLHSVFGRRKKPGLTDLVLGTVPFEAIFAVDCVPTDSTPPMNDERRTKNEVSRLFCLPSGTVPPSPADVLNSAATSILFEKLSTEYDCIIIDSPPVLVAADTAILSSRADATILVVRAERTPTEAIDRARSVLLNSGARVLGCVFNGVRHSRRHGRYHYYHYYKYHHSDRAQRPEPGQGFTPAGARSPGGETLPSTPVLDVRRKTREAQTIPLGGAETADMETAPEIVHPSSLIVVPAGTAKREHRSRTDQA